jgi:hypothetical protein
VADVQRLSLAEQLVARRLHRKVATALKFLTEAKECAFALTPDVLAQLKTQEALIAVAKKLGEIRDHAKGERKPEAANG